MFNDHASRSKMSDGFSSISFLRRRNEHSPKATLPVSIIIMITCIGHTYSLAQKNWDWTHNLIFQNPKSSSSTFRWTPLFIIEDYWFKSLEAELSLFTEFVNVLTLLNHSFSAKGCLFSAPNNRWKLYFSLVYALMTLMFWTISQNSECNLQINICTNCTILNCRSHSYSKHLLFGTKKLRTLNQVFSLFSFKNEPSKQNGRCFK